MHLSKTQKNIVSKYNQNISNNQIKFSIKPCLCSNDVEKKFTKIYSKDRYGLFCPSVICMDCGLVQLRNRLTDDDYSKFYISDDYRLLYGDKNFLKSYKSKYSDVYNTHILNNLSNIMKKNNLKTILEYGCGGGWKLLPFYNAGYKVTGYDFSSSLVKLGKDNYGLNLIQGSANKVKGMYDVIVINHVLEHLTDFFGDMSSLLKHLNPNGVIYVGVPNIDNFSRSQFQNAHIYYFSPRTFKLYMSKCGLNLIEFGSDPSGSHMYGIFRRCRNQRGKASDLNLEYSYMKRKIILGKLKVSIIEIFEWIGLKKYVKNLFRYIGLN